jgi:hypothetical protein
MSLQWRALNAKFTRNLHCYFAILRECLQRSDASSCMSKNRLAFECESPKNPTRRIMRDFRAVEEVIAERDGRWTWYREICYIRSLFRSRWPKFSLCCFFVLMLLDVWFCVPAGSLTGLEHQELQSKSDLSFIPVHLQHLQHLTILVYCLHSSYIDFNLPWSITSRSEKEALEDDMRKLWPHSAQYSTSCGTTAPSHRLSLPTLTLQPSVLFASPPHLSTKSQPLFSSREPT